LSIHHQHTRMKAEGGKGNDEGGRMKSLKSEISNLKFEISDYRFSFILPPSAFILALEGRLAHFIGEAITGQRETPCGDLSSVV
jgi:hypothetical protein